MLVGIHKHESRAEKKGEMGSHPAFVKSCGVDRIAAMDVRVEGLL